MMGPVIVVFVVLRTHLLVQRRSLTQMLKLALIIKPSRVRTLAILLHLLFSTRLHFLSSHPDLSSRIDLHDSSIPHRSDIGKAMDGRAILKPRQRCHVGSPHHAQSRISDQYEKYKWVSRVASKRNFIHEGALLYQSAVDLIVISSLS